MACLMCVPINNSNWPEGKHFQVALTVLLRMFVSMSLTTSSVTLASSLTVAVSTSLVS